MSLDTLNKIHLQLEQAKQTLEAAKIEAGWLSQYDFDWLTGDIKQAIWQIEKTSAYLNKKKARLEKFERIKNEFINEV